MTEETHKEREALEEPNKVEESSPNLEFVFGEEASKRYPGQVTAAIEYAAANTYDYGPRMREIDLAWEVVSAEPMANEIVRIRLQYSPVSGFRGDPGLEYMDVDANGAVLARRQLNVPRENRPVLLMGFAAFSVVLAVVMISLMTVFERDTSDPLYVAGRTLWIRAEEPKQQQYITYSGQDSNGNVYNWAMKPSDESNNELTYVQVTLINQTSGTVNLVVDENSAKLLDGDRVTYKPINTIESAYTAERAPQYNVPGFVPLWGSVKLNEGELVSGMMVFEMPRGSTFSELRWTSSDSASIKYQ